jgi:ABC-type oligopeptide transport system substrate-binding subunit
MHNQKLTLLSAFGAVVLAACGGAASSTPSSTPGSSVPGSSSAPVTSQIPENAANGIFSYAAASYSEKAEIIGALEKYAQDNYMTGIPLYDSGGLVMYNDRLSIPSDVFIPNFGFGVGEGTITSPMTAEQEPVEALRSYYHTWTNVNVATLNNMNGQTSTQSDFYGTFSSSYYTTRLNAAKDNYEWVNELATARPIALNADSDGLATKWKVPLRVGGSLVYSTLSTDPAISVFNNRPVALEDYLTPFKLMLNERWFRATDLGSATGGFVGVSQYTAALAAGQTPDFSTVGIKLSTTENAIEFEFNQAQNSFFALLNLSSSLYSPIPEDFITAIGGAAEYGKPSRAVDTVLSLGAYVVEDWEDSKQFVFRKNPSYINADKFNFAGIKYAFIADANTAFNEFIAGKLDAVGIPAAQVAAYKTDPRTRNTLGAAVFKLNLNATTPERWEELFGVNGQIAQTPEADYWDVKPIMSNKNFLDGLYFSIDREELAESQARNPAQGFLSDAYMADPENAIPYRSSVPGLAAYAERSPETLGFNREIAKQFFKAAGDELVAEGAYLRGTSANPTTITLKVHHQAETRMNAEKPFYSAYIEDVFNEANPGLRLVLDHFFTAGDVFAPYDAMGVGQFDIAMGTISGSTLNPLSFMEILTSDNRTGFTLSWTEVDTARVTSDLQYDGKAWSFNALFEAGNGTAVVSDGEAATLFNIGTVTVSDVKADTFDVTATGVVYTASPTQVQVDVVDGGIYIVNDTAEGYTFISTDLDVTLTINAAEGTWTLTLNDVPRSGGTAFYVDLYVRVTINGRQGPVQNIFKQFSVPAAS